MPELRMYDTVTLVCGENTETATTIRAILEGMRLRVDLYAGVWQQHLLDFFAGKVPCSKYVVCFAPGALGPGQDTESEDADPDSMGLVFRCVAPVPGTDRWTAPGLILTPPMVRQIGHLPGKRLLFCGCGSGRRAFADAFLDAGCDSYIGFMGETDGDAGTLFVTAFFYHLMTWDRDPRFDCSEVEAFERAAALDMWCRWGTHRVRYHTREGVVVPAAAARFQALADDAGVPWPPL